jgi:hypothetical protein
MRVRLHERSVLADLAAALERAGGSALVIGDTLELVHPSGTVAAHENCELEFFVRAWVVGAEHTTSARVPVEILG